MVDELYRNAEETFFFMEATLVSSLFKIDWDVRKPGSEIIQLIFSLNLCSFSSSLQGELRRLCCDDNWNLNVALLPVDSLTPCNEILGLRNIL